MSVRISVFLSERQYQFARRLVDEGSYASLSAVVRRGIELMREEIELKEGELAALKTLIERRTDAPFISDEEGRKRTLDLIAKKKKENGL